MDAVATATTTTTTTAESNASNSAVDSAEADFETFLTLLTTQMKNQDPLKPLESTEFIAQLATFSAVEQQIKTNVSLANIENALGGASPSNLSNWLGVKVQVQNNPEFTGEPIEIFVAPADEADRAELVIYNTADEQVRRLVVAPGTDVMSWSGDDANGNTLAYGTYKVSLESFQRDVLIAAEPAPTYDIVKEARLDGSDTLLILGDGTTLHSDQVQAVRGG